MAVIGTKPENVPRRAAGMLWMLGLQFVFGMGLNLVGPDATGGKFVFGVILFVCHVLIALGLLINGALLAFHYKDGLAKSGAWIIVLTIASGGLTLITKSDVFSFLMAMGFLASAVVYVRLYERTVQLARSAHSS